MRVRRCIIRLIILKYRPAPMKLDWPGFKGGNGGTKSWERLGKKG